MQLDGTASSRSLASRIGPPQKRAASQAAALKVDETRGPKQARLETQKSSSTDSQPSSSAPSLSRQPDSTMQTGRSSSRANHNSRGSRGRGRFPQSSRGGSGRSKGTSIPKGPSLPSLSEPLHNEAHVKAMHASVNDTGSGLASDWKKNPKSALANFMSTRLGCAPNYEKESGLLHGKRVTR